jgi:hypothetical protein
LSLLSSGSPIVAKRTGVQFMEKPFEICFDAVPPMKSLC